MNVHSYRILLWIKLDLIFLHQYKSFSVGFHYKVLDLVRGHYHHKVLGLGLGHLLQVLGLGLGHYWQVLGLGLGHFCQVLGLGLGLATRVLGLGLGLEPWVLGLGLGLVTWVLVNMARTSIIFCCLYTQESVISLLRSFSLTEIYFLILLSGSTNFKEWMSHFSQWLTLWSCNQRSFKQEKGHQSKSLIQFKNSKRRRAWCNSDIANWSQLHIISLATVTSFNP